MKQENSLNFIQEKRIDRIYKKLVNSYSISEETRRYLKSVGIRPAKMYGSCKVHKIVLMAVRLSCQYYLLCKHPVTKLGNSLVPILEPLTINKCTVQD